MTPLEKALARQNKVNYCDECENFLMVDGWAYCKDSGKMIHPIMCLRMQGTGGAYNCTRAIKKRAEGEE